MAFQVPERWRLRSGPAGTDEKSGCNGVFAFASIEPGWLLYVIASDGLGWEHASVHAYRLGKTVQSPASGRVRQAQLRTPTWREMCQVKGMFWDDEDPVMQLHPRRSQYVNQHPHVLHLWKPIGESIPEPPVELVGILAPPTPVEVAPEPKTKSSLTITPAEEPAEKGTDEPGEPAGA